MDKTKKIKRTRALPSTCIARQAAVACVVRWSSVRRLVPKDQVVRRLVDQHVPVVAQESPNEKGRGDVEPPGRIPQGHRQAELRARDQGWLGVLESMRMMPS